MSRRPSRLCSALLLAAAVAPVRAAPADAPVVVFCAPGSPGTTEEAQAAMDAFAGAVASRAGLATLRATYAASEDAGVARLRAPDAALAVVSLPFFLKHERALSLRAAGLQPVVQGGEATERWSLVARRGAVTGPGALEGFTVLSSAGFAPAFIRGPAVGGFGPLPAGVKVAFTAAVLSALRRAAAGDPVAVLLDGAQAAALPSLAFAKDLEVVARSAPLPAGLVATVGRRLAPKAWSRVEAALRHLPDAPDGAAALAGLRVARFAPLDDAALAEARRAHAEAAR